MVIVISNRHVRHCNKTETLFSCHLPAPLLRIIPQLRANTMSADASDPVFHEASRQATLRRWVTYESHRSISGSTSFHRRWHMRSKARLIDKRRGEQKGSRIATCVKCKQHRRLCVTIYDEQLWLYGLCTKGEKGKWTRCVELALNAHHAWITVRIDVRAVQPHKRQLRIHTPREWI